MGNIGDPITPTIPAVGTSGTTYASNINDFLTEVKARLEAAVPRASLAAGDLDLDGDNLQNAGYLGMSEQALTPAAPIGTLQRWNNDLYWISGAGAVKITDGAAINSASFGGITGDYGGVNPAQFRFVDADQEFYAYDNYGTGTWARIWARGFDIAAGATSTDRVRLAYGGAGSYTLTFPAAVPGTTTLIQMQTSGQLVASNTITEEITAAGFNHTNTKQLTLSALHAREVAGSTHAHIADRFTTGASVNGMYFPAIGLVVGDRIISYSCYIDKNTSNLTTISVSLIKVNSQGSLSVVDTEAYAGNATNYWTITGVPSSPQLVGAGEQWFVLVEPNTTTGGDLIFCCEIEFDHP